MTEGVKLPGTGRGPEAEQAADGGGHPWPPHRAQQDGAPADP